MRRLSGPLLAAALAVFVAWAAAPELHLKVRSRVESSNGRADWRGTTIDESFSPSSSALILCDMWDNHWCQGAAGRVGALARKMAPVIDVLRSRGFLIIHAPSETMKYYADAPQRLRMKSIFLAEPPASRALADPPLR
ncbi:MAG TPA: isochorismatase, partial [Bryobacteraceae bacterium]